MQSMGYSGDPVQISNSTQGDDGFTWYEVQLASGTAGWVRGDLVSAQAPAQAPAQAQTPSYSNSDDAQPPTQAPAQAPYQSPSDPAYGQSPYGQSPSGQAPYGQAPYQPPYALPPSGQAPQQPYQQPYGRPPYSQPPYSQPGQSPYGRDSYDQSPYAQPGREGRSTLTARDPGSAINIREFASPNSQVRYRANPGDPVQIAGSAQGDDGFTWYQVRFSSGAAGWVRGDLLAGG
ncbi:MAG: SH3 domain-containing protein [Leptolyngbyaceae cyanobacterium RM1_1_2]|nr:SH3 domain-containing protein [Leptolyngbyaceae cyanobacterium RM1_1_2]